MEKYKLMLLKFLIEVIKPSEDEKVSVLYWTTDRFGDRISEISGIKNEHGKFRSGWSIMAIDQGGLHVIAAAERLLLAYSLVDSDPDDGYQSEVEAYEDMLRSLLSEGSR
ncbi:hypothetical protein PJWF_00113 [Achromobacter phage JWF]|uniref:hypothetical protein n=1 Tax=Achromobacter phage JWF TaxID=1589748 RepID=UPI000588E5D0|nr:hypothetical protein AXJ13_gp075 [Achromobacter phage JWF]AJD83006.1 hypothetical protein PJWF_00113 [Achromobacter phage JWF]